MPRTPTDDSLGWPWRYPEPDARQARDAARAPTPYDETFDASGRLRADWEPLVTQLRTLGLDELRRRWDEARRLLYEHGVSYDAGGGESLARTWNLSPIPVVFGPPTWEPLAAGTFLVVARTPGTGGGESGWIVDLDARTVTAAGDGDAGPGDAGWNILGSPETWDAVLSGRLNLHVAMRRCDLRYCSAGEDGPFDADTRVAMLAGLLGFSSWAPPVRGRGQAIEAPVPAAAG